MYPQYNNKKFKKEREGWRKEGKKEKTKVEGRKMERMNKFGIQHICTCKCHNEILCKDILNN
jgi:hypothetical protein